MISRVSHLIVACLLYQLLLSACSPSVYFDSSPSAAFSRYRSFALLPRQDTVQVSIFSDGILDELIERSIVAEMKSRKLEVDTKAPDLIAKFHLIVETREDIISYPNSYYPGLWPSFPMRYPYYPYYGPFTYQPDYFRKIYYKQGTLIIDVFERETGKLTWRGWSVVNIDSRNKFEKNLPDLVQRIFSNYPVPKAP